MKSILICHENDIINRYGFPNWLASFSDLVGIVTIQDSHKTILTRVKREICRSGIFGFIDVLAFRIYYRLFWDKHDITIKNGILEEIKKKYHAVDPLCPILHCTNPNDLKVKQFIQELNPDFILARCKHILRKEIFTLARQGTFVLHPGKCPEYRNAHGCFWALVAQQNENVLATLLKIDCGVDTGPIYGYYSYPFISEKESHIIIQEKVVTENLENIKNDLINIISNKKEPLQIKAQFSKAWGQPWLSKYLKWKFLNMSKNGSNHEVT